MTIFDIIEHHYHNHPDKIAFVTTECNITYGQLYKILSYSQNNTSIQKSKAYILKSNRSFHFIMFFLLIISKEAWAVPISDEIKDEELNEIKRLTSAEDVPLEDALFIEVDGYPENLKKPDGNTSGIYHMTSGTTGLPKFCIRTLNNLTKEGSSYVETFGLKPDDKILNTPPLTHSFALGAALCSSLVIGASLYVLNAFNPKKVMKIVINEKITVVILVPAISFILLKLRIKPEETWVTVRMVISGAGKVDDELNSKFLEKFHIPLLNNYGSTETGGVISRLNTKDLSALGKPMSGVSYKVKKKDGMPVAFGERGELFIKTDAMGISYLNNEVMELDEEGYINMRDIVINNKDDNIYLQSRRKDMIRIGSKKVYPLEIIKTIKTINGITDCFILRYTRKSGVEAIAAFIETKKEFTDQEIREYCRSYLSDFKIPQKFVYLKVFPKNNVGKIRVKDLMDYMQ